MPTAIAVAILGAGASAFAVGLLSFAISYVVAKSFAPDGPGAPEPQKDQGVQSRVPADPKNKLPIVYGEARIAGTTIFADISSDNQTMAFLIALSEGPVESIHAVEWEDKKLTMNLSETPTNPSGAVDYNGKNHTFLNSDLKIAVFPNGGRCPAMESFSSRWNSGAVDRSMPNVAYIFLQLKYNREKGVSGLPSRLYFHVKGRKVDQLQSNGAMTTSAVASSNPVDCLIDYLTNTTYGGSIDISKIDTLGMYRHKVFCDELKDYTRSFCSFSAAGSAETDTLNSVLLNRDDYDNEVRCIQQVSDQANFGTWNQAATTLQAKRYSTNGVIRTGDDIDKNISHLTIGNGGAFSYNLGKFGLVSEGVTAQATRSSVPVAFSEDNIVGRISISSAGYDEKLNELTARFDSVSQRHQEEQVIIEIPDGSAIRNENEPRLERTLKFQMLNNNVEVVRAGTVLLNQSRQDLVVSFETDLKNSDLQAGDVVSVSHDTPGWVNKLFKIQQVEEKSISVESEEVLGVSLTLREYAATDYDDSTIQLTDLAPNTTFLDPFDNETLNVSAVDSSRNEESGGVSAFLVSWSDSTYLRSVEVRYKTGTKPYQYLNSTGTSIEVTGVEPASTYSVEVRPTNTSGKTGEWEVTTVNTLNLARILSIDVLISSDNSGNVFNNDTGSKQLSTSVFINNVETPDYTSYSHLWRKEGSTLCVDGAGNVVGLATLDVQASLDSCESAGGIWVPGQIVGFQCTSDGVNTTFDNQTGNLLGCATGYRADSDNSGLVGTSLDVTTASGSLIVGKTYRILTVGNTDFTLVGASANTIGIEFIATGVGTGTGTARSEIFRNITVGAEDITGSEEITCEVDNI